MKMSEGIHAFHFLPEIAKGNTYRLLFPEQKAGMAIIYLYEKIEGGAFQGNFFKESDIHDALAKVAVPGSNEKQYHLKEQYNTIISNLQEYFLRYDEECQRYCFKEYAFAFCKYAKETLKAFFDPTQIELICTNLRNKLETCNTKPKVLEWFSLEFDAFKPRLKNQLDYLDKQIDQSVAELRANRNLSLQEGNIIETLRQIDTRFEVIREQNKELRTAFRAIDDIRKLLIKYAEQYENDEIDNNNHIAITFFQEMRYTLNLIDKRLDRIQPRIKQLFSNLNKPLFNVRIEKFIGYLIRNSQDENLNGKKNLFFPAGIKPVKIHSEVPDFTIVERRSDLFPLKPQKRIVVVEDTQLKQKAFTTTVNKIFQQDDVSLWLDIIEKDLTENLEVDLTNYFFKIFDGTNNSSLNLAIAVVYASMKHFERQQKYELKINPDIKKTKVGIKTIIWEILVKQR